MKCEDCRKKYPPPDVVDGVACFVCSACGNLYEVGNYDDYLEVKALFDAFPHGVGCEMDDVDFLKVGEARYQYQKLQDDRYFWAAQVWWNLEMWKLRQQYLIGIIGAVPVEDSFYLRCIGAGPLEDLLAENVLEFISSLRAKGIELDSEFDKKLCIALQGFRFDAEGEGLSDAEARLIGYIEYHYPDFTISSPG